MRSQGEVDGFSSYAAGRWAALVRTSVLLGVPPSAARALAGEAIARARSELAGPEGGNDLDAELFGELIEAHRRDRRPWWLWAASSDDLEARTTVASVQGALDRLTPPSRARLVLAAVALLPPDQVDQVVAPTDDEAGGPDLVVATAAVAAALPVAPVDPDLVSARGATRSRRRVVSFAAVAIGIGLAMLAATSAVMRPSGGEAVAVGQLPTPAAETSLVTLSGPDGVSPVAWYAGGVLHLGALDVPLAGVVALDMISKGVVATLGDGRLVEVDGEGAVSRIARITPGAEVATSTTGNLVAYIGDDPHELTVYDTSSDTVLARVPVDTTAEVAAVDGLATYVNDSDGHSVIQFGEAARRTNGVTVLDAAGGVLAIASGPGEVQLLRDGVSISTTAGDAVDLSPDGRFALVSRTVGAPAVQVVDLGTSRTVELALPDDVTITDAAFVGDEALVLVARGPNAAPSLDRDDPDLTPRRSDLITCDVAVGSRCVRILRLGAASTGPILAH